MTPLDFLRWYESDERSIGGDRYSTAPLDVEEGERVGVVLMNLGGPNALDDVKPFLYNLLMDPALLPMPVGGGLRHGLCRALAAFRAESVQREYELIGGRSPLTRLTREQADSLQGYLDEHFGAPTGIDFRTYVAMRYWHPFSEEAAAQMAEDGVDRVVLLPLYPQYSQATTGSALAYWEALADTGEIPSWPTTTLFEYAANPKYVQALSERIDEGLQRFPRAQRGEVQLLFNAHGPPRRRHPEEDPYCCLVHSTVHRVMQYREDDRPCHLSFQNKVGLREGLSPSTATTLTELATEGVDAVLVVPLTFATDHFLTSYGLDIEVREQAETAGIPHFEITAGLNTHPLFIETLAEATVSQLNLPVDVNQLRVGGDGLSQDYPLRSYRERPRADASAEDAGCSVCDNPTPARRWRRAGEEPESEIVRSRDRSDPKDAPVESTESRT
jgi:ferrochelatase